MTKTKSRKDKEENRQKVWNSLNYQFKTGNGKIFTHKSQTVPDQTMSLKTLLDRYSRGLKITGNTKEPIYLGEDGSGIDFEHMDLADREDMIIAAKEEIKHIQSRITDQKKKIKIEEIEQAQQKDKLLKEEAIEHAKAALRAEVNPKKQSE